MRINVYDDEIGNVTLIDYMGDDLRACHSARVSFLRDDPERIPCVNVSVKDRRLITFLLEEGHTSPFEHSVATFRLRVPMYVRTQIMRHRTFSYNEVSRRYTSEGLEVFIPRVLRGQSYTALQCSEGEIEGEKLIEEMRRHARVSLDLYHRLIGEGVAREQARSVLPQSMYTTFWMTGSIHNFMKFFDLRITEHAQSETRDVATAMREILSVLFPVTFESRSKLRSNGA